MKCETAYGRLRASRLLAIIPVILAAGPLVGYLIADLLIKKLALPGYTAVICVILGFIASIVEIVIIIRIALKAKEQ